MGKEITLEGIKGLIIEAYSQVDMFQREQLLVKAESLEQLLIKEYRGRGLKLTADNIAHTLKVHKMNQLKR